MDEEQQRNELFGDGKAREAEAMYQAEAPSSSGYTAEQQRMLHAAKQKNVETTKLAHEALKVVEQTSDTAAHTLAELHRQDAQLDKIEKDYDAIEEDIKESKRALSYMDRCCLLFCCACCCDCDADAKRDKTRKQRVAARRELTDAEKKHADLVAQDKGNRVLASTPSNPNDVTAGAELEMNAAAMQRQELMGAEKRLKDGTNHALRIGEGLEDKDKAEIQSEIQKQEDALDQIGDHLDRIMGMAQEMNQQLVGSDQKIDRIAVRNEVIDGDMRDMQRKMKGIK